MENTKTTFKRKSNLSQTEIDILFEIIKDNMLALDVNVTQEDYRIWSGNLTNLIKNDNVYFYIIYSNNNPCGFVELIEKDGKLTLCELQLNNKVKKTRLILTIIEFLFQDESISQKDEMYFHILKNNYASNSTFCHLGAKKISENERSNNYILSRQDVANYFENLKKKHSKR